MWADLQDVDLTTLVHLCNGINEYEDQQPQGVTWPPRERGTYLERPEVREFALWAADHETELHGWMFDKAGIVAEMFASMQNDTPVAQEFWRLVLTESHPESDHETREVSRVLKDLSGPKNRVDQERLRKEAAKYWRRYRKTLQPATAAA